MSIERKMFHITQIGVVLLTLTLCTGLFYMHNLFSTENIDKAVLSIVGMVCLYRSAVGALP
ncbi:cytochrome c-type biogenesis heme exporter protein C [Salmonella enterica subsp. enterica]|uniref:Cytochrome c-type biogenesis heme exporter protein C n=1 Tax=Salmonella enterica I TaxID=59201 RepID=A0A379WNN8_SALET|nr:cytochrome c-type biogenesis heme exporter protein C [Salmonella enterica subsp. enterica]